MLPRAKRLNLKKDFKWVATGIKIETKYLKLFIKEGENRIPKIGIAISSDSFKKATQRSRAKRLTSAAFQAIYPLLPSHLNIVAIPKTTILDVKSADVLLDLEGALIGEKIIN